MLSRDRAPHSQLFFFHQFTRDDEFLHAIAVIGRSRLPTPDICMLRAENLQYLGLRFEKIVLLTGFQKTSHDFPHLSGGSYSFQLQNPGHKFTCPQELGILL